MHQEAHGRVGLARRSAAARHACRWAAHRARQHSCPRSAVWPGSGNAGLSGGAGSDAARRAGGACQEPLRLAQPLQQRGRLHRPGAPPPQHPPLVLGCGSHLHRKVVRGHPNIGLRFSGALTCMAKLRPHPSPVISTHVRRRPGSLHVVRPHALTVKRRSLGCARGMRQPARAPERWDTSARWPQAAAPSGDRLRCAPLLHGQQPVCEC